MSERGTLRTLLALARLPAWAPPTLIGLGLAASLAEGISIGLFLPLLDTLLGGGTLADGAFARTMQALAPAAEPGTRLLLLGGAILALMALRTAILAADLVLATRVAAGVTRDLRVAVARQLLEVGWGWFSRHAQGRLFSALDDHTHRTSEALLVLGATAISACTVLVGAILLLLLSPSLALIVGAMLAPALLLVWRVAQTAHRRGQVLTEAYGEAAGRGLELLANMRTVRIFGQEDAEARRYAGAVDRLRDAFVRAESLNLAVAPVAELLYLPAFLAVLAFGWWTDVGLPTLLVFLLLLYRMQPALKRLDQARVTLASLAPSVAEVAALLRRGDKPYLAPGTGGAGRLQRSLVLERVSFRHAPDRAPALVDISFELARGEVLAVVGPSGAGKSTLVDLLCRLQDPGSGRILVDGTPLSSLDANAWRQRIAFAGQDADLVDGTLRENLRFGSPEADDAAMHAALARASAAEFVAALPGGLDAQLGPRGTQLSGGQRQRVALARALLRDPDLLLLDEATSSVDQPTERAIHAAVRAVAGRTTVVLITHRPEALEVADRVLVLAEGRGLTCGAPEAVRADPVAREVLERLVRPGA